MSRAKNMTTYDVIVIGVGAMGSAAAYHLSKRGYKVLGLEQFDLLHELGSSHGQTRIIRQAYFEHEDYVPLLKRSYELWWELEEFYKEKIFYQNGMVIFAPENDGLLFPGIRKAAKLHSIPLEELSFKQATELYKNFKLPKNYRALFEPGAGFLRVELGVAAHIAAAKKYGADIRSCEAVLEITHSEHSVRVKTNKSQYDAAQIVVCAGAWSKILLEDLAVKLKVHRNLLFWFDGPPSMSIELNHPCFGYVKGREFFYGFPAINSNGVKIAEHFPGYELDRPEDIKRENLSGDRDAIENFVKNSMPKLGPVKNQAYCYYTMSPNDHFIIDVHPEKRNMFMAAGFSGHGYKFAPVVGEILADYVESGSSLLPANFLRLKGA